MDDTATNLTNTQAVMPPTTVPAAASVPPVAAPSTEDLQKITQDLQNLAQEVSQTPAPVAAVPVATVEPVTSQPVNSLTGKQSITIYTITDCQYCQAEKEFLKSQGLEFVEKNVETNEESLKEMLSVGENFAGVPVTVLEGPTGQKVVVKGFTQTDFEEEMKKVALAPQPAAPVAVPSPVAPVVPAVVAPAPTAAPTPVASAPLPQIPNIN